MNSPKSNEFKINLLSYGVSTHRAASSLGPHIVSINLIRLRQRNFCNGLRPNTNSPYLKAIESFFCTLETVGPGRTMGCMSWMCRNSN
jgi:hypothetical protein